MSTISRGRDLWRFVCGITDLPRRQRRHGTGRCFSTLTEPCSISRATPTSVIVPHSLVSDLQGAARALNGAVAIVSGRALADIDRLLSPLRLAGGSEHGVVVRLPDGTEEGIGQPVPVSWTQAFIDLQEAYPGVAAK